MAKHLAGAARSEQQELRRLNRTLRALGNSSHALVHASDERRYLEDVCRIVVEDCGHAMVWIGFAEQDEARTIRPVAHAGFEKGYLETLHLTWADTERGQGPTGTAIRTGRPCACKDMRTDPRFLPWREEATRRGYASSIVFPLLAEGGAFGALTIYSREPDSFSREEQELLAELSTDLAYGITALRSNAARKRAEEGLRAADRNKNEFLAQLSHELRNPLAPIRNGLYLLDQAPPGSEQAARALAIVRRQTDQLARLVDDLLDVTRISCGKVALERSVVDACELTRQACDDLRDVLQQRRVQLRVSVPDQPVWIDADPTRMTQVLTNLLHNAAKFTPGGRAVLVSLSVAEGRARLAVRDQGIGIEPELLEVMFQPFAQGQRGLARDRGGLGLGLALVKGLVDLHGGAVTAESRGPDLGSEFVVSLPLVGPPRGGPAATSAPAGAPCSVLIVEDDRDSARALADILELKGYRVQVAFDGRTGVARAQEVLPDVVLCDIGLPDVDGHEVARRIRAVQGLHSAHLVALSGYAQAMDRDRAREAGFDAHLGKPVPIEQLLQLLRGMGERPGGAAKA